MIAAAFQNIGCVHFLKAPNHESEHSKSGNSWAIAERFADCEFACGRQAYTAIVKGGAVFTKCNKDRAGFLPYEPNSGEPPRLNYQIRRVGRNSNKSGVGAQSFAFSTLAVRFHHNRNLCVALRQITHRTNPSETKVLDGLRISHFLALRLLLTHRASLVAGDFRGHLAPGQSRQRYELEHELSHVSVPGLVGVRDGCIRTRDPATPLVEVRAGFGVATQRVARVPFAGRIAQRKLFVPIRPRPRCGSRGGVSSLPDNAPPLAPSEVRSLWTLRVLSRLKIGGDSGKQRRLVKGTAIRRNFL
jgi:hypothetical protein